ncbi:50S ribosomal protein L16 [Ureaplasma urealyticum]|uniref:Large ribosomal subunit protein uL16 n=3 Tax=Ureaplasma urealyticum TaxID=2130 RepID=RL16_UREU1|nr:50S ribosomal protein L16 [Ureaplasma urealyticum]B5ZB47.1 RecName: Full=Large ribosomal subunit protein uL16; AltName: Full=50S ribosomal protein L16 [Ureaplasma urealyticum serovar 10 str. ATCC 33699]EDX53936.1 ribosomal protein L16 [Ureaplasma urealyticum serovar 9 str. ATCC 33175]ACI60020.1 ribosomal protein L16 [Ureaplasma urealyticum serovar 10 str. ATCC 33699]EDT49805.1 ribosomal protein L16 [Ureaplasma urealyticum serovar 13 str. ATCC 33698]EDU06122.1 ribosomal protein L16 [Ureaplas
MLQPKRTKFRKPHKVSYEGKAKGNKQVDFGEFGLMALEGAWIDARQIESARIAISKRLLKTGKMWIRIFPHMSLTKKPLEVRMGSGKGSPEKWVAVVKAGTVMFEIANVSEELMREALRAAGNKLPIKVKIVKKGEAN